MNKRKNMKGMSFLELFVILAVIFLVITMGMPEFNSFLKRMELKNTLRTITGALNTARYKAIMMNKGIKFCIEYKDEEDRADTIDTENEGIVIRLKEKNGYYWEEFMVFDLESGVGVAINSSPVFSPNGSVAPLCSILVDNKITRYKITISIAGRVKITEIRT